MTDRDYMLLAIDLAKEAAAEGEVPVGAVVVRHGEVIGTGRNRREKGKSALAHAELEAIEAACKNVGGWRLWDCEMYVTLEPCQMCAGALVQCRIDKVYIGAMNKKAGCAGSVINLLDIAGFNHQVEIETGILGDECSELMSSFFRELRKRNHKIGCEQ
jgi:tRNA(adenine34) deaminase